MHEFVQYSMYIMYIISVQKLTLFKNKLGCFNLWLGQIWANLNLLLGLSIIYPTFYRLNARTL